MAINILCEDVAAKAIINTVLPYKLQSLSSVIAYGGKSELIKKAKIVQEINQQAKIVIIWDGEVESTFLQEATNEGFIGLKLPSSFEPEQYMLQKLNTKNGINFLINKYEFTEGDVEEFINELSVLPDIHDIPWHYGQKVGKTKEEAITELAENIGNNFKGEFEEIINSIKTLL